MSLWVPFMDSNFPGPFDARNEEEKHFKLKQFEREMLITLLIESNDPVIKDVRDGALVAVKLAG